MSYNSKKTIISVAAGVLLGVVYAIYALSERAPAPGDLKSWATAMLVFLGVGIAAIIVIQILFHVAFAIGIAVKEREQDDKTVERIIASTVVEDERDKLVSLRSGRIGYITVGVGFVAMLIALAFGLSAIAALHILFAACFVGSAAEGVVSVYLYEKGSL